MKIKNNNSTAQSNLNGNKVSRIEKVTRKRTGKDITLKQNLKPKNAQNKNNKIQQFSKITQRNHHINQSVGSSLNDHIQVYEKQIMSYLRDKQEQFILDPWEINKNMSLSKKVRSFLIKFFFKIKKNFHLKRKTVHLATYYLDSFIEKNHEIKRSQLIIYAQAALWISMKYQQIYPPEIYQWVSKAKIPLVVEAEADILCCLDFKLGYYCRQDYFQYYASKLSMDKSSKKMTMLLIDLSLFDENNYKYKPQFFTKQIIYTLISPKKVEEKMEMAIKWMIQRNQQALQWLQQHNQSA